MNEEDLNELLLNGGRIDIYTGKVPKPGEEPEGELIYSASREAADQKMKEVQQMIARMKNRHETDDGSPRVITRASMPARKG